MKSKTLKNPRVLTALVLGAVIVGAIFWFLSSTYQVSIFNSRNQQFIIGPSVEMQQTMQTSSGFVGTEVDNVTGEQPADSFVGTEVDN